MPVYNIHLACCLHCIVMNAACVHFVLWLLRCMLVCSMWKCKSAGQAMVFLVDDCGLLRLFSSVVYVCAYCGGSGSSIRIV